MRVLTKKQLYINGKYIEAKTEVDTETQKWNKEDTKKLLEAGAIEEIKTKTEAKK